MAKTRFSGPVFSDNGFGTPLVYVTAADTSPIDIPAGATVVILSAADGGPAAEVTLRLPKVSTTNGGTFTITNADPNYTGIRGAVLNYGAVAHVLAGTDNQPVNQDADGVVIAAGTLVQWAGNGNPSAPWAAGAMTLCAGNT